MATYYPQDEREERIAEPMSDPSRISDADLLAFCEAQEQLWQLHPEWKHVAHFAQLRARLLVLQRVEDPTMKMLLEDKAKCHAEMDALPGADAPLHVLATADQRYHYLRGRLEQIDKTIAMIEQRRNKDGRTDHGEQEVASPTRPEGRRDDR